MRQLPMLERTVRRAQIYGRRLTRMGLQQSLKGRCAFMHLPKCGGTSLSEGLYGLVPLHQKIGILDSSSIRRALSIYHDGTDDFRPFHDESDHAVEVAEFREKLLLMHMAHDCRLIHGHFLFSRKAYDAFGDLYRFITIMRDPVERTFSNLRMARRNKVFNGSIQDFVTSSMGRRMALHGLRYFSGMADIAPEQEATALEIAKENMAKFTIVGFIDRQDKFLSDFKDSFGASPRIGHYNGGNEERKAPDPEELRLLEPLCETDITLYAHARRTFL